MANIAQSDIFYAAIHVYMQAGCDFSQSATVRFKLSRRDQRIAKVKANKFAMHLTTGTDAFHDLLADIATLGEVERLCLSGLLRQIAIANVLSILRDTVQNAPLLQSFRSD